MPPSGMPGASGPPQGGPPGMPPGGPPGGPPQPQQDPNAGLPPPQPPDPNQTFGPRPKDIPLNSLDYTIQPNDPNIKFLSGARKRLSEGQWNDLANQLCNIISTAISSREAYDKNLKEWSDAYDMIRGEKNFPYEDSANLSVPFLVSQIDSVLAYLAGTVLVPRLYIVTGNTPEAGDTEFAVEKYYNAELTRLRAAGDSYFQRHVEMLHMSLRDGVCVMEVLWHRLRKRVRAEVMVPNVDDQGQEMGEEGDTKSQTADMDYYIKDYAEVTPVLIKDFLLIPAEAQSIETAAAVARACWFMESELEAMVRSGVMDREEVEKALSYVTTGNNDVTSDRMGTYDKSASRQLDVGPGQGTITSEFFANRGPIKVWRIHSKQFDMNKDGLADENIFWFHEQSQSMLGWIPYEYTGTTRPFFAFSPLPRPGSFYGYSFVERLAGIQTEIDANRNARRDREDLSLSPPILVKSGAELISKYKGNIPWGPNKVIEVEVPQGPEATLSLVTLPEGGQMSWQDENALKQYGSEFTGLNDPARGGQSSGRRTATEMKQQSQASSTRINLMCSRFRVSCTQIINFVHSLNRQHLKTSPQTMVDNQVLSLPLEVLNRDYTIGVAGSSDPIDSTTRRNEILSLYDLVKENPMIDQYYLLRALFESFGRSDVQQLMGTKEQFQQKQQAMQQAAQQAQQQGGPGAKPGAPKPH